LAAARDVDNAQAPHTQADSLRDEEAFVVWTPMDQRSSHPL
jgi:hypothetical protein